MARGVGTVLCVDNRTMSNDNYPGADISVVSKSRKEVNMIAICGITIDISSFISAELDAFVI